MGILDNLFGSNKKIIATSQKELDYLKSAKSGNLSGVKEGLQKGVKIDIRDNVGNTALWLAACYHHYEICEYLIQKGADVNAGDSEGTTPFGVAYMGRVNNPEILELFELHKGKYQI